MIDDSSGEAIVHANTPHLCGVTILVYLHVNAMSHLDSVQVKFTPNCHFFPSCSYKRLIFLCFTKLFEQLFFIC